jgi:hypothetical protein
MEMYVRRTETLSNLSTNKIAHRSVIFDGYQYWICVQNSETTSDKPIRIDGQARIVMSLSYLLLSIYILGYKKV